MKKLQIIIPKMVHVSSSNCGIYTNSQHTQFHYNLYNRINGSDLAKLNISPELMSSWKDCIDLETDINKQSMRTTQVDKMKVVDESRNKLLSNIFGVVKAQKKSPIDKISNAANEADVILKPYARIQNDALDSKTSHIRGLLQDAKKLNKEFNELGLAASVAGLEAANTEYQKLHEKRQEKGLALKLPSARDVRQQTDAVYNAVCRTIEASYLFAKDEDKPMIEQLVEVLNAEVSHFKTNRKASIAQKKRKGKGADKNKGNKKGKDTDKGKDKDSKEDPKEDKAKKLQKEFDEKIAPLLSAFEQQLKLQAGTLSFAGEVRDDFGKRYYKLKVKDSDKTLWTRIEVDHLIEADFKSIDKKKEEK